MVDEGPHETGFTNHARAGKVHEYDGYFLFWGWEGDVIVVGSSVGGGEKGEEGC